MPSSAEYTQDQIFLKIGKFNIKNFFSEKLLNITFDCKLKFSNHIEDIYKKATRKMNALSTIVPYIPAHRSNKDTELWKCQLIIYIHHYLQQSWTFFYAHLQTQIMTFHSW